MIYIFFKNLIFKLHFLSILFVTIGSYFERKILFIYPIIILSWWINNNKCIISQIEYYLFNETFIGKGPKYFVPKIHRYIFYSNFLLGIYYHFLK